MNDSENTVEFVHNKGLGSYSVYLNGRKVGTVSQSHEDTGSWDVWVWVDHQTVKLHEVYRTLTLAQAAAQVAALELTEVDA